MAITIIQKPKYKVGPAVQDWVWALTSTSSTHSKFKYVCDVYFFQGTTPYASPSVRLKFSKNMFSVGIINLRQHIEQQVRTDTLANFGGSFLPSFKGATVDYQQSQGAMSVHLIDKFTLAQYNFRRMTIKWGEEYATSPTNPAIVYPNLVVESNYGFWNGCVPYGGQLDSADPANSGGVNLQAGAGLYGGPYQQNQTISYFLSNAPTTQYVRDGDYHTLGMLSGFINGVSTDWTKARVLMKPSNNGWYVTPDTNGSNDSGGYNGSGNVAMNEARKHLQYLGCGPGNLMTHATFAMLWGNATGYEIKLLNSSNDCTRTYKFIKQEDDCKGYETIRLTWLNRHGCWDYYNFTKKSYRELSIEREYTRGDKNDYQIFHQKHGASRVNSTFSTKAKETIKANTDWVDDETSIWLEELYTSPDVYMLGGLQPGDPGAPVPGSNLGYVTPVQVSSKKYERYSSANDKVAQHEIEIELDGIINVQKNQRGFLTIG